MQDVMNIYEDYLAWKKENFNLISTLVKQRSDTIKRFSPVIAVVDYLYEKQLKKKLSEDEELIFSSGFDYIHDAFMMIDNILQSDFNNSIPAMEKCSKTINLLLYVIDFESEITESDELKKDIQKLYDLDQALNEYLEKLGRVLTICCGEDSSSIFNTASQNLLIDSSVSPMPVMAMR